MEIEHRASVMLGWCSTPQPCPMELVLKAKMPGKGHKEATRNCARTGRVGPFILLVLMLHRSFYMVQGRPKLSSQHPPTLGTQAWAQNAPGNNKC